MDIHPRLTIRARGLNLQLHHPIETASGVTSPARPVVPHAGGGRVQRQCLPHGRIPDPVSRYAHRCGGPL